MPERSGDQPRVVWSPKHKDYVPIDADGSADVAPDESARALPRPPAASSGPARSASTRRGRKRHYVITPDAAPSVGAGARRPPPPVAPPPPPPSNRGRAPTPPRPPAPRGRVAAPAARTRGARAKAAPPRPAPAPPARSRRPPGAATAKRWATRRRLVGAALAAVLLVPFLLLAFAWWQFNRIERVDTAGVLSPGGGAGTNYLIVGSDSREGIDEDDPNAGAFIGSTVTGERTDTIMVLRMEGDRSFLLSIPRDLWVTNAATGEEGRINAVYRSGPPALIQTVQQSVGIPIHHYLEIDFVSFGGLVDAVGGITIDFPHPARDDASGLFIEQSGPVTLDGTQALAYVRSRTYTELVDGEWRTDPTGDLGRTERQRAFLSALLAKATGSRNPITLMRLSSALGGGLAIDDTFTFFGALRLAWNLRGFSPESVLLPTTPFRTSGGAAVLDLDDAAAAPIIQQFSS